MLRVCLAQTVHRRHCKEATYGPRFMQATARIAGQENSEIEVSHAPLHFSCKIAMYFLDLLTALFENALQVELVSPMAHNLAQARPPTPRILYRKC